MANLVNIWSETFPDIIGDDTSPTLALKNTSSGVGLLVDTNVTSGTGAAIDAISANTTYANRMRSAASAAPALTLEHSVINGPTIAVLRLVASGASTPFFDFRGAVASTASLGVTAANVVGLVPVWFQGSGGNNKGWMPIYNAAVAL